MSERLARAERTLLQASRDHSRLANDQADRHARHDAHRKQGDALWAEIQAAYPALKETEDAVNAAFREHADALRTAEEAQR